MTYKNENNQVYNTYVISVKLSPKLYSKFWKYCRVNNLNKSSGLKNLLNSHPEINDTETN